MDIHADRLLLYRDLASFEVLPPAGEHEIVHNHFDWTGTDITEPLDDYVARDPYPLPTVEDREGYYHKSDFNYWASGLQDYAQVQARIKKHGIHIGPEEAILELGCASGRVLRHFFCQGGYRSIWGVDLNTRHVEWIRRFLPADIMPIQTSVLPHLPIPDASLGLVFAFSVFTHIDEYELAWIAELRRMLRPGGVAYLTVHTERTWERLTKGPPVAHALRASQWNSLGITIDDDAINGPLPAERFVAGKDAVYGKNIFQSRDYLRSTWGRFFDILSFEDPTGGFQDGIVLRRPVP